MRTDLLLKYLCLVKSRSMAKNLCESGAVKIGERLARPSSNVTEGDRLTVEKHEGTLVFEVLQVPDKQLSRSAAPQYYERVRWTPREGIGLDDWEDDN